MSLARSHTLVSRRFHTAESIGNETSLSTKVLVYGPPYVSEVVNVVEGTFWSRHGFSTSRAQMLFKRKVRTLVGEPLISVWIRDTSLCGSGPGAICTAAAWRFVPSSWSPRMRASALGNRLLGL